MEIITEEFEKGNSFREFRILRNKPLDLMV